MTAAHTAGLARGPRLPRGARPARRKLLLLEVLAKLLTQFVARQEIEDKVELTRTQ